LLYRNLSTKGGGTGIGVMPNGYYLPDGIY